MLPTSVALALGFLALAWGLVQLQQVFSRERDEARGGVASRRAALTRYAERSLAHELEERLRHARPEIERALTDALARADHLLFFDRGKQRLPRKFVPRSGDTTPGGNLLKALRLGQAAEIRRAVEADSPWARRLILYDRFAAAVNSGRGAEVSSTFRTLLGHRQRYLIERTLDLPYMLAVLDFFATEGQPDPGLLRALLHDGLSDGQGGQVHDLSRLLLESRERFTVADFEILSGLLVRLAEGSGAPYQAFLARVREETGKALVLESAELGSPALVLDGGWYVAPTASGHLQGVAVDFGALLIQIGDDMEQLGLLSAGDKVVTEELPTGAIEIGDLDLRIASPAWQETLADVAARYRLKTGLGALCAMFAVAIVTLAVVLQHRRHQLLELKADFVATVSHELRTPLASVRLLGETLERRLADHPPAKDYPSRIVREIDGLSFLVENILSFHRLEKGRWRIQPTDVPMVELVDFLRSELELHITKPVRLSSHGLDEIILRGDPELLRLLFLNLARNACQYHDRETVRIDITAIDDPSGKPVNQGCRLHFRDNGWGIAPGETRKIFTEFHRSRTGGGKGTGLGLAICRRIMKLHGGEIQVAETSPEGTTFELKFKT